MRLRVSDAMMAPVQVFPPQTPIAEALKQTRPVAVADEHGLWGVIDPAKIADIFLESGTLADVFHGRPDGEMPHLHIDHSLAIALDRMGSSKLNALPVVSRANVHQLLGLVTLEAVLNAYGFAIPPPSPTPSS